MANEQWYFQIGTVLGIVPAIVTFFGGWWYCTAEYGFLWGFGFGWVPSLIAAALVEVATIFLWAPILAAIFYFFAIPYLGKKEESESDIYSNAIPEDAVLLDSDKSNKMWMKNIDGTVLTFKHDPGAAKSRTLIEYRELEILAGEDPTCTKPYKSREEIISVGVSEGGTIESFSYLDRGEIIVEYPLSEYSLPPEYQGHLQDILKVGDEVSLEMQKCGQGQVPYLIGLSSVDFSP